MAWRPSQYLIEGELDNTATRQGHRLDAVRRYEEEGDLQPHGGTFHRDIRRAEVAPQGEGQVDDGDASQRVESHGVVPGRRRWVMAGARSTIVRPKSRCRHRWKYRLAFLRIERLLRESGHRLWRAHTLLVVQAASCRVHRRSPNTGSQITKPSRTVEVRRHILVPFPGRLGHPAVDRPRV